MRTQKSRKPPVRLGIVGIGNMGIHHARMVADGKIPGLKLAAVCDQDPSRLGPFEKAEQFDDHRKLIRSGTIDALLIATPHYSHTRIGIDALTAGLHVLVEKPISVDKGDALRLLAAHQNKKQVFAAMFNQRTDPCYRKIRDLVQSGKLGRIQRIQWTVTDWFRSQAYYDSGGWRATWKGEGGGVLLNQAVHNIDLFQWIFGMPDTVKADCSLGQYHDIEVEDDVTALMRYTNGCTAVLTTSTGEAPGVNRLEIAGDAGRLTLENGHLLLIQNTVPTSVHSKRTREAYLGPKTRRIEYTFDNRGEQHAGILKNFANAIRKGERLVAPAAEGIHSVELINTILMAALEDKTVKLPLSAPAYRKLLKHLSNGSRQKKNIRAYRGAPGNYLLNC